MRSKVVAQKSLQTSGPLTAGNTSSMGEPLQSASFPKSQRNSREGMAVTKEPVRRQRVKAPPRWGLMWSRIWPARLFLLLMGEGLCIPTQVFGTKLPHASVPTGPALALSVTMIVATFGGQPVLSSRSFLRLASTSLSTGVAAIDPTVVAPSMNDKRCATETADQRDTSQGPSVGRQKLDPDPFRGETPVASFFLASGSYDLPTPHSPKLGLTRSPLPFFRWRHAPR